MIIQTMNHSLSADQATLDFQAVRIPVWYGQSRPHQVHEVKSVAALFHPESSHFSDTKFALKFSFRGRSYQVEGSYHVAKNSQFRDDSLERAVDFVHVDKILSYYAWYYRFSPISKQEERILTAAACEIIKNPYHNSYLTLKYTRSIEV